MPKIGRTLSYINTERKGKSTEQSSVTQSLGSSRPGGTVSMPQGDYLLKSIWDKVFEIRTDSQGIEYIFGKLPMVTQYGITMYSGDGVDIPSLASGLPFDGRTIWYNPDTQQIEVIGGTGGGSGEGVSNFWDLSGIPSWITNSKPKYTYSEIEGTPDLTQYALVSQIPSLSGYATESWVTQQNYATKATTLSGYGITDAYTKTNVDELLKTYVTLGGTQTITGEKNFTGGLKVNGSPIYYDTEKKYWKLEGDLLVTGGVTMYGSDSSFTPSTIMDAILYDDATLGINSNGQLYVKGGTSGGGLDITALQNYLTQNSYLNVTGGDNRYLMLSGGTITGSLEIKCGADNKIIINNTDGEGYSRIVFQENGSYIGQLLSTKDGNIHWGESKIWHSGNFNPSNYLPLSGGTLTGNILLGGTTTNKIGTNIVDTSGGFQEFTHQNSHGYIAIGPFNASVAHIYTDRPSFYFNKDLYVNNAKVWNAGNDGSGSTLDADLLDGKHLSDILSSNVASATKLQTPRTIWGQSFDGTGNVSGIISGVDGISFNSSNAIDIDYNSNFVFKYTHLQDWSIQKQNTTKIFIVRNDGNVGINTDSPRCKFSITSVGTGSNPSLGALATVNTVGFGDNAYKTYFWTRGTGNGYIQVGREDGNTTAYNLILQALGGNVGIGTESPLSKCDINGLLSVRLESSSAKQSSINLLNTSSDLWQLSARYGTSDNGNFNIYYYNSSTWAKPISINKNGNLLVTGGITMYSDQRKKTILNHVELSLKQIADAPLIEHYYNSDDARTTHVGSIAQYWASMNDWFCKLDSEGYYTMEIQNAALASAISIARELDRYETKTDKAIKKLKKHICELEEEVERLKCA